MNIKGIDLYKKVLEEDNTVLGRVFEFENEQIRVAATFGASDNQWGLQRLSSQYGSNLLHGLDPNQINDVFKAEWIEVRQALTFTEVLEINQSGSVKYIVEHEKYILPTIYHHLPELLQILIGDFNSVPLSDILINGQWYIEN